MNLDHSNPDLKDLFPVTDRDAAQKTAISDAELRDLAEDIVRYCPSLTHLLLALGSKSGSNPLKGLN